MMDWIDQDAPQANDIRAACYGSELDQLPANATDEQIAKAMAEHLVGSILAYKTTRGARKMLLKRGQLLRAIAEINPELWDWVFIEYAEHAQSMSMHLPPVSNRHTPFQTKGQRHG